MSTEVVLKGFFAGLFSLAFAWSVFSRYDKEIGSESKPEGGQRYLPLVFGALLPVFLLILVILGSHFYGIQDTLKMVLAMCFRIFLHLCVYYVILGLLLPLFRRHISARACAMLWLIPNYLYITEMSYMELPEPLLVIHASSKIVSILFSLWIVGFISVFLWKIGEHLVFRREILRNAKPVTDKKILEIFQEEIEDAGMVKPRPKFKLITSPDAVTPLTIGLFKRSTRVILPTNTYTDEELKLIFRHELIHIGREDSWSKFFMMFCTAMCWFNPLMWIAMKKSAEDTELSCDETVLLDADDDTRKKYANLILKTAGNDRGFTTCLSASASSMRYRLKSIVSPGKKHSGALIVGAVFFILCMTSGYVALAYEGDSGAQLIYQCEDYNNYVIRSVSLKDDEYATNYEISDAGAFHSYLADLTLYELTGNYSFNDSERCFTYLMDTQGGTMAVLLFGNAVKTVWLHRDAQAEYYYVPEGIDWDYIETIIIPHPAMNVYLKESDSAYPKDLGALLQRLWRTEDGEQILVHEEIYPEGEYHGIFGNAFEPIEATFDFSYELAAPFKVLVESWDYSTSYNVSQTDLHDGLTMDLPDYSAHYTVYASFYDKNRNLYEAEFWFNLGDIYSN